eukprot:562242-Pelagomonas_calceolata.AAC.2
MDRTCVWWDVHKTAQHCYLDKFPGQFPEDHICKKNCLYLLNDPLCCGTSAQKWTGHAFGGMCIRQHSTAAWTNSLRIIFVRRTICRETCVRRDAIPYEVSEQLECKDARILVQTQGASAGAQGCVE